MKKALVAAFYLVQGLVNLVYGLFFVRVDVSPGGSGGVTVGLEFMLKGFLLVSSGLSLFAVLALILRRGGYARTLGALSSALFMSFYGLIAFGNFESGTALRGDGNAVFWLLASIGIVVLNFVALLFLHSITEKDQTLA